MPLFPYLFLVNFFLLPFLAPSPAPPESHGLYAITYSIAAHFFPKSSYNTASCFFYSAGGILQPATYCVTSLQPSQRGATELTAGRAYGELASYVASCQRTWGPFWASGYMCLPTTKPHGMAVNGTLSTPHLHKPGWKQKRKHASIKTNRQMLSRPAGNLYIHSSSLSRPDGRSGKALGWWIYDHVGTCS